jgi:structural maintenance of chromosome 4
VEVGQQCIDYLRKNNLGRANFILLDRLPRRDLSAIETPENVPRLYDLVNSRKDIFNPAFYSVLQNTLVARDLTQANRIAYGAQRWRVVTLDGQLIDKSGTMSGGGTRVAKGGMSSKAVPETSKEQVAKLEVDRDSWEKEFATFQGRQRELESELKELQDQVPRLETEMQKISLEIDSLGRTLADAQRRAQELDKEHQPSKADDVRKATLEKQIATLEKEVAKLHSESAGLEEEIKSLQDKIMEVGGVKLRSQKAKVDGLKEQIDGLNEDTSAVEVSKAKAEKQLTKQQKAQAEAERELQSIAEQLEELSGETANQSEALSGSKQKVEEAQDVSLFPVHHFSVRTLRRGRGTAEPSPL